MRGASIFPSRGPIEGGKPHKTPGVADTRVASVRPLQRGVVGRRHWFGPLRLTRVRLVRRENIPALPAQEDPKT
eukprot:530488-Pyramimonas_sp.AAC.1